MRAEHITFSEAIKVQVRLLNFTCTLMALLEVICWALIFVIKICFSPGKSLVTILIKILTVKSR